MADILEKSALGKGTFGSVVLIDEKSECDPSNIRKVAMKKPCKEPEHSTIKNERFMLSNLDHPNIIKLFGFAVPSISENNPTSSAYQLCEYCTGGELFHIISTHGPLEEDVARNYFFQLMLALNYLHTTARVVHRDLKPENILVTNHGKTIKLCDFGTAVKLDIRAGGSKRASGRIGSLSYAAPEIYKESLADFSSDIWSAGVVLYVMFCAASPFRISGEEDGEKKAVERVKKGDINRKRERYKDMPSGPKKLISRIMQLDPSLRPVASLVLSDPWLACGVSQTSSTVSSVANLVGLDSSEISTPEQTHVVEEISREDIVDALVEFHGLDGDETCWLAIANQLGEWSLGGRVFCALDLDHDGIVSLMDLCDFADKDVIMSLDLTSWFGYSEVIAALLLKLSRTSGNENVKRMILDAVPFAFDAAKAHVNMEYDEFCSIVVRRNITDSS